MILERDMRATTIPDFPTVSRMTLGMNTPMLVPSAQARERERSWNDSRGFSCMPGMPCLFDTDY